MKYNIAGTGLEMVVAIALIAGLAVSAHAEGPCSMARAAGNWSFNDNGTVVGIGPRIAVGTLTLDDAGNVLNGQGTSSLNGATADETFSGTYTVSPNCNGTINVTIYSSGVELFTVKLNAAFDRNMRHMRALFTSVVEPNGTSLPTVIGLDASKQ
jgi:hypothetical protein